MPYYTVRYAVTVIHELETIVEADSPEVARAIVAREQSTWVHDTQLRQEIIDTAIEQPRAARSCAHWGEPIPASRPDSAYCSDHCETLAGNAVLRRQREAV